MAINANFGIVLKYESAPSTFIEVPGDLLNVPSFSETRDTTETTNHAGGGYKSSTPTLASVGEITVEQTLDFSLDIFRDLLVNRTKTNFRIEYTQHGYKVDVACFCTSWELNTEISDVGRVTTTLTVTGAPTFSTIS